MTAKIKLYLVSATLFIATYFSKLNFPTEKKPMLQKGNKDIEKHNL